jgi:hypothetical protein
VPAAMPAAFSRRKFAKTIEDVIDYRLSSSG